MECRDAEHVVTLVEDLGEIRSVFCDACRTIAVDARDALRKRQGWAITYLDPRTT